MKKLLVTTALIGLSGLANAEELQVTTTAINNPQNLNAGTFLDREGSWNYSIKNMRANFAHAKGYDGRIYNRTADGTLLDNIADGNVIVAVIDTGIDYKSTELDGNLLTNKSVTCTSKGCTLGAQSTSWHGTGVAGVIAAERNGSGMNGVAYNSKIMAIKAIDTTDGSIQQGINYAATNKAAVINNSYAFTTSKGEIPVVKSTSGTADSPLSSNSLKFNLDYKSGGISLRDAVQKAVDNKSILVFAAGNGSMSEVGLLAGLPYYFRGNLTGAAKPADYDLINPNKVDWSKNFVAAVSVDSNNQISSFSNKCGVAKEWCIAAPGDRVITTYLDNKYVYASGTSFAAPNASGALAALIGAFPHLSPEKVTQIMFKTATDLGAAGVDDVYGNGLINMERAINPSDSGWNIALGSNLATAKTTPVISTSLSLGKSFGKLFSRSADNVMFVDEFERDYQIPLSYLASSSVSDKSVDDRLAEMDASAFDINIKQNGTHFKMALSDDNPTGYQSPNIGMGNNAKVQKASFTYTTAEGKNGYEAGFGYNAKATDVITPKAFAGTNVAENTASASFENPYLGLAASTNTNYAGYKDGNVTVRFGSFSGNLNEDTLDINAKQGVSGMFSEVNYTKDNKSLSLTLGANNEESSFLGSSSSGALNFGNDNKTVYAGLSGKYEPRKNLKLIATANLGLTKTGDAADSLVTDVSDIVSSSFAVGLEANNVANDNDSVQLVVSQPLRVESGSAKLTLPQDINTNGDIIYSSSKANLNPSGREIDAEGYYNLGLSEKETVKLGSIVRFNPNHDKDADPEAVFLAKYSLKF
jgi:subtilisin family serine protease